MDKLEFCLACLSNDVKMYNIINCSISNAYVCLTGISDVNLGRLICFECAALLRKYEEFRSKCSKAHEILCNSVTKEDILHMRNKCNLGSNLEVSQGIFVTTYNPDIVLDVETDIQDDVKNENIKKVFIRSDHLFSNIYNYNSMKQFDSEYVERNKENDVIYNESDSLDCDDFSTKCDSDTIKKKHTGTDIQQFSPNRNASDITGIFESTNSSKEIADTISTKISNTKLIKYNDKTDKGKENLIKNKFKNKVKVAKKRKVIDPKNKSTIDLDDLPLVNVVKPKTTFFFKKTVSKLHTELEGYATIIQLTPEQSRKELELRKETNNYKNCPHKCELCFRGYENPRAFDNHMKKHSMEHGEKECEYCHLRFKRALHLFRHNSICHKRKYCCKICPYYCYNSTQAKHHMYLHKGKKYTCQVCGVDFSMPNSLLMHKRMKHPTECVCGLCGSTFATDKGLAAHQRLIHEMIPRAGDESIVLQREEDMYGTAWDSDPEEKNDQQGPNCDDCGVHFANELAWKRHLVLSAKHEVSNGCETCGETFPSHVALRRHMKIHARKQRPREQLREPAKCPIEDCDKWLTNHAEYKKHMWSSHRDSEATKKLQDSDNLPFVCEFCGKKFKKSSFLKYHQRQHTGEKPYACEVCGKAFAQAGAVAVHRVTHEAGPTHTCNLCGKPFKHKAAVQKHIKVKHLNIRPYKCSVCGKAFPNPCIVKDHMRYVHCKVPWPKRVRKKKTTVETYD